MENMQKAVYLIIGTLIQRWLETQVANLTCPQHKVQYLWLLQESIWPGGVLPNCPCPVRIQEQNAAVDGSPGKYFPRNSWGEQMQAEPQSSLGVATETLNQQAFDYCLWIIILEFLDLSAFTEDSTITTSASDTPGNSKRIGISAQP